MKICPYCNSQIPEEEILCPHCGKEYWVPEMSKGKDQDEKREEEEEKPGCLQIFLIPLITAIFSVFFLIFSGIIINLFTNFESNQVKIAWLLGSVLVGLAIYYLLSKNKKQSRR